MLSLRYTITLRKFYKGSEIDLTYRNNLFLTEVQRQFNWELTVFSTNGIETTGHSYKKDKPQLPPNIQTMLMQ